jgi:hypothetical protein
MTVEQAQASSIEVNKTPSRQRTAVAGGSQISKFGIKAKLFLAFFSLAALTALASAVAWYVFRDIDRAVTRVTVESVPGIITALSAAEKSAEIAAAFQVSGAFLLRCSIPQFSPWLPARFPKERAFFPAALSRQSDR